MSGADPLRYFRQEARDTTDALEKGLLVGDLESIDLRELFRLAHNLKGAAQAVEQTTVAELAHTLEDVLAHHRDQGDALTTQERQELLKLVDAMRSALPTNEAGPDAGSGEETSAGEPANFDRLRIDLDDMDALAASVLESQVHAAAVRHHVEGLQGLSRLALKLSALATGGQLAAEGGLAPRVRAGVDDLAAQIAEVARPLSAGLDKLQTELVQLSERTSSLRLVDLSVVFPELERAAHDAAQATSKRVDFAVRASRVGIDGHVLAPLRGALLHLVRNAVAHGVEPESTRTALGKPPAGKVEVRVERRGTRVAVSVEDDGQGIDVHAIVEAARARGLTPSSGEASLEEGKVLMFEPGVSTATEVSAQAGRGVGLDAVRQALTRLKGQVEVSTSPGSGTRFEITVPTSLSTVKALEVVAGGQRCLVPLDAIEGTQRLTEDEVIGHGEGAYVVCGETSVPFRVLAEALSGEDVSDHPRVGILSRSGAGLVMIGVDSIQATREVMVRPLPLAAGHCAWIAGAAFDSLGKPELVLDPDGFSALRTSTHAQAAEHSVGKPILVVDDSLTTRMLEQSILEAAGYKVELACSAEEGLDKARATDFGLIVVDVEMPGMNGYEFTETTRRTPELAHIPVIMVSSLSSDDHVQRSRDAGASAYMIKGEFDQDRFLRTVSELMP